MQKEPTQLGKLPNRLTQNFTFLFACLFLKVLIFKDQGRKACRADRVASEKFLL